MDILINIGMLIICLLAVAAMAALLIAIIRVIIRSGILKSGATTQEVSGNFIRAFFVQNALKQEGEVSSNSSIWRTLISFIIMLGMGLVVFLYLVPQLGINS